MDIAARGKGEEKKKDNKHAFTSFSFQSCLYFYRNCPLCFFFKYSQRCFFFSFVLQYKALYSLRLMIRHLLACFFFPSLLTSFFLNCLTGFFGLALEANPPHNTLSFSFTFFFFTLLHSYIPRSYGFVFFIFGSFENIIFLVYLL